MALLHVVLKTGTMNKENINTHESNFWYFKNEKKKMSLIFLEESIYRTTY